MRNSTKFGFGGASFLIIGLGMVVSLVLFAPGDTGGLGLILIYGPVATVIAAIGAYWLWKAQGFYVAERALEPRRTHEP
jgi:hypothetical protein